MKIIEFIYKFGFGQFLLRGVVILSFLSICFAIIGFIIAIPTDYGRYFFFYSLSFIISIFFSLLGIFPFMRFAIWLQEMDLLLEKVCFRIKFRHHDNWQNNLNSENSKNFLQ